jgi:murein L,D-transpeptidase YcbB/YkuD
LVFTILLSKILFVNSINLRYNKFFQGGTMTRTDYFIFFLIIFLCIPGCVTAPLSSKEEIGQLKAQVSSLQSEVDKQKSENAFLRQQLVATGKKEIRMPTGREIQTALKKAGFYKGNIDGQIGSKTKEAIKKFQEANKINPDGVVGSRTWVLLQKYLESQ